MEFLSEPDAIASLEEDLKNFSKKGRSKKQTQRSLTNI